MQSSRSVSVRVGRHLPIIGTLALLASVACAARSAPRPVSSTERPSVDGSVAATQPAKPSLVVLIAADQFKADFLTRYAKHLNGGLARLVKGGAHFTDAHQDHAITETAPGHASLLSGRFPRSTGIMLNREGVDDSDAPLVAGGYGTGASPKRFIGTTLADWMKAADSRTKTLSLSMKDRSAILPIGRSKSDVYWYSVDGRFLTSTYYAKKVPAWVDAFNERRLPASYAGKAWELLLAPSEYPAPDSIPMEMGGKDFLFPHRLVDDPVDIGIQIRITPFMDEITLAFALHGLESMQLGKGPQTDLLSISLSATDVIGHNYGPESREMHDQVVRLDRMLGRFLDSLYTLRDSSKVTLVFTSDHGAAQIPELVTDVTPKPVRANLYPIMPSVRAKLRAMKLDTFAVELDQQILLVDRAAFRKPADLDTIVAFFARSALEMPGVARVDRWSKILADSATDPIARRWAHQFPIRSNVEMVVTLHPQSTWGGNVASHGSPYDYDTRVPLIFAGAGVSAGVRAPFVRTVDIAPTLAELLGVKPLEKLDGVPLPIR